MNLEDFPEVPAHVRMIIWLGLEKHQEAWTNREQTEGDFCVYAETVCVHYLLTTFGFYVSLDDYPDNSPIYKTLVSLSTHDRSCSIPDLTVRTTVML